MPLLLPDELAYLNYLARRIDHEVRLWHEGQQGPVATTLSVRRLAALAGEILGEDELPGWLEAATRAREIGPIGGR